jgi:hypothetical protein
MRSSPAKLSTRWRLLMNACVQHPTATAQHTASSTHRALGIRHSGRTAIGSAAAITRMTAATALISLNWTESAGLPGSRSVPPTA